MKKYRNIKKAVYFDLIKNRPFMNNYCIQFNIVILPPYFFKKLFGVGNVFED